MTTSRATNSDRSYGGKGQGGIWLKKKRRRSSPPVLQNLTEGASGATKRRRRSDIPQAKPSCELLENRNGTKKDSLTPVSSDPETGGEEGPQLSWDDVKKHFIGWDDVKCRPIFHVRRSSGGGENGTLQSSKNDKSDDVVTSEDGNEEVQQEESESEDEDARNLRWDQNRRNNKRKGFRKKRAYGSTVKKAIFTDAVMRHVEDFSPPNSSLALGQGTVRKLKVATIATSVQEDATKCRDSSPILILQPKPNSDTKQKNTTRPAKRRRVRKPVTRRDPSEECTEHEQATSTSQPDVEADSSATRQPNGNSSLDSARAYYENLDSTHTLTVAKNHNNGNIAPSVKLNAIRTSRTRRKIADNPKLKADYRTYYKSVKEVGVSPIAFHEFASQWSEHFSTEDAMCDGLLDEE